MLLSLLLLCCCHHALHPDCSLGDFSFALSLVDHHKCKNVTATCYDSEEVLHQKYPQTREILERLLKSNEDPSLANKHYLRPTEDHSPVNEETTESARETRSTSSEWEGLDSSASPEAIDPHENPQPTLTNGPIVNTLNSSVSSRISFHASVSAQNLLKTRPVRHKAPYNKIVFNFPHTGGLSRDVNRQVRANQELLVAFFKSCKPLLASKSNPVRSGKSHCPNESYVDEEYDDSTNDQTQEEAANARTIGQVIISLFDGEPYSLWNIRDLARHSGFKVVTSWRFPWEAHPGYRHARTIGEISRKSNGVEALDSNGVGDRKKGAWKGEERAARGFVFELTEEEQRRDNPNSKEKTRIQAQAMQRSRNKRTRSSSSSGSET